MIQNLAAQKCVPCEFGTPPMSREKAEMLIKQIKGWQLLDNKITKQFVFQNFKKAMEFVNKVAQLAEAEGHHPDIYIFYNKVKLQLMTHASKGLTENDFILAAKIDNITT